MTVTAITPNQSIRELRQTESVFQRRCKADAPHNDAFLNEPSLAKDDKIVGHTPVKFQSAEFDPRDARQTKFRHRQRSHCKWDQVWQRDLLESWTSIGLHEDRRATATCRATLCTIRTRLTFRRTTTPATFGSSAARLAPLVVSGCATSGRIRRR